MCIRDRRNLVLRHRRGGLFGFRLVRPDRLLFLDDLRFRLRLGLLPVSYTHLDVYKRQELISPMRIGPAPWARTSWGTPRASVPATKLRRSIFIGWVLRLAAAAIRSDTARTGLGRAIFICIHMNGQIPALVNLPFLQCSASAIDGQRLAPALREISQSSDFNREFRRPKISQRCCPFGLAGVAPVSYTHLDVYKRQGSGRYDQARRAARGPAG